MPDNPLSGFAIQHAMAIWRTRVQALIDQAADTLSDEEIHELLDAEQGDVEALLGKVLVAAVHDRDMVEMLDKRVAQMQARSKRIAARHEWRRAAALAMMEALDRPKHEMPELLARANPGSASIRIIDESRIPSRFWRVVPETRTIDKVALKAAITKDGEVIQGVEVGNGSPYLVITTR